MLVALFHEGEVVLFSPRYVFDTKVKSCSLRSSKGENGSSPGEVAVKIPNKDRISGRCGAKDEKGQEWCARAPGVEFGGPDGDETADVLSEHDVTREDDCYNKCSSSGECTYYVFSAKKNHCLLWKGPGMATGKDKFASTGRSLKTCKEALEGAEDAQGSTEFFSRVLHK